MTEPVPQPAPKPPKTRLKVEPEAAGQLEQLLVQYNQAKGEADAAGERADELKAAIKAWLLSLFPDGEGLPDSFNITGDAHGRYPGYTMTLKGVGSYRLDTDALKTGSPETYVQYAKPVKPSWTLTESPTGRGRRHG